LAEDQAGEQGVAESDERAHLLFVFNNPTIQWLCNLIECIENLFGYVTVK